MKTLLLSSIIAVATLTSLVQVAAQDNQSSNPENQQQRRNQNSSTSQNSSGTKVSFNQLPAPVQKTFRSESGNLNVENVQKVNKNDQTCYTGTFDKGSLKGRLTVAEDGSLLEFQQAADIAIINQAPRLGRSEIKRNELPQAL